MTKKSKSDIFIDGEVIPSPPSPPKPPPCRILHGFGGETKESKQRTKEWSNNLTDEIDIQNAKTKKYKPTQPPRPPDKEFLYWPFNNIETRQSRKKTKQFNKTIINWIRINGRMSRQLKEK